MTIATALNAQTQDQPKAALLDAYFIGFLLKSVRKGRFPNEAIKATLVNISMTEAIEHHDASEIAAVLEGANRIICDGKYLDGKYHEAVNSLLAILRSDTLLVATLAAVTEGYTVGAA